MQIGYLRILCGENNGHPFHFDAQVEKIFCFYITYSSKDPGVSIAKNSKDYKLRDDWGLSNYGPA